MSLIINENNGKVATIIGGHIKNMTISNGRIIIDGKNINELGTEDEKVINLTIQGDVERLDVDVCTTVTVEGNASRVKTNSGDIKIHGNVSGDVKANCGNITCGDVEGDCNANCGSIYRR